jgi:hypothetical protein
VRASRRWAKIKRIKLSRSAPKRAAVAALRRSSTDDTISTNGSYDGDDATPYENGEAYTLSSSLLGAAEAAALMQACLASPLKDRQVHFVLSRIAKQYIYDLQF